MLKGSLHWYIHARQARELTVAWVALGHHGSRLKGRVGDLCHRQLLVVGLLSADDRCIAAEHEVDPGVGHQVGLELSDVHVQGTIEAQRGGQGGDHLQTARDSKKTGVRIVAGN
jgi:hypothetical protein